MDSSTLSRSICRAIAASPEPEQVTRIRVFASPDGEPFAVALFAALRRLLALGMPRLLEGAPLPTWICADDRRAVHFELVIVDMGVARPIHLIELEWDRPPTVFVLADGRIHADRAA